MYASSRVADPARLRSLEASGLLSADFDAALDRWTRLAAGLLGAPVAMMSLVDRDRQYFKSHVGLPAELVAARGTALSHSFCRHVVNSGEALAIDDAREHPLVRDNGAIHDHGMVAYAAQPLSAAEGHTLGTLCVIDTVPRSWTGEELALLADLAAGLQAEIDLREAARRSSSAGMQAHGVLRRLLHEREPELEDHAREVAVLAGAFGRHLGLDAAGLGALVRAAELHDIGKVAIPDQILHKPGVLTPEEWRLIRTHTLLGERILTAAPALAQVGALVRSSQERWDGQGYPDALAGGAIPYLSRVLLVCIAFHAMTSPRPYRDAVAVEQALAELQREGGRQFDPAVVDAFCAHVGLRAALAG